MSNVPAVPDGDAEVLPLAHELAAAYKRLALWYRDQMDMTPADAEARARGMNGSEEEAAAYLERILDAPADHISWFQLQHVLERDPDAMRDIWQGVWAAPAGAAGRCDSRGRQVPVACSS